MAESFIAYLMSTPGGRAEFHGLYMAGVRGEPQVVNADKHEANWRRYVLGAKTKSSAKPVAQQPVLKAVTLLALNTNPGVFDGQTLTVRGDFLGRLFEETGHYRATVRGARTTADGSIARRNGMNFVVRNGDQERLMEGLEQGRFYPVRLTVMVKQDSEGYWIATVLRIERKVQ